MCDILTAAEIIKLQKAWLDKLQTLTPKPILVKAIEGAIPDGATEKESRLYQWNYYGDILGELTAPIYTRGILNNEILLDPDVKDWGILRHEFNKIIEFCKKENIPLQLAYTGGKGVHGDIIFGTFGIDKDNFDDTKIADIDLYNLNIDDFSNYVFEF